MKKMMHLVLSLTIISAVCAAVLASVNSVTKGRIAGIKTQAKLNAAKQVMPKSATKVEEVEDGVFAGKNSAGKAIAYAVVGSDPKGYGGEIRLMVGLTADFTVVTYRKLEAAETPGLGSNLTSPDFMKQFGGMSAAKDLAVEKDGGDVKAITSATITSRAVCGAVNSARAKLQKFLAASK